MLNPKDVDYKKLGFHAGLEVHHQINSSRKLFCHCKPEMVKNNAIPDYRFERYFRPVLGEMGDFDPGMLIEYEKGYRCIYNAYESCDCIYEQDEQPPFWPDIDGAVMSGYELSHWMNMSAMVDEIIFSRKQYLDGSITTGFQRTTIVSRDGYLIVDGKKHRISNITVEEDSARKIRTENFGRTVYYNLDRLGVPLVEVITDHTDIDNPHDLEKFARMIGLTLRISGIGKRGIGTARQDVNISIAGGDRVELKGVQDLRMFEKWCCYETIRQDMLIKIKNTIKERGLQKEQFEHTYIDLSDKFSNIPEGFVVMGIRIPQFNDIFALETQPGKDFGQDVIEKASLITGIPAHYTFLSHELGTNAFRRKNEESIRADGKLKYPNFFFNQITSEKDAVIREELNLQSGDAYFLAVHNQKWVIHTLKKVIERVKLAFDGVPQETRRALPDGTSEFLRVIHGKERLYPDTDTPLIDMDMTKVAALKEKVGKRPWEIEEELKNKYGFSFKQVERLIRHNHISDFYDMVENFELDAKKVYQFLEEDLTALRREGKAIEKLAKMDIIEILTGFKEGKYDASKIEDITRAKIEDPNKQIDQILQDLKITKIYPEELERLFTQAKKIFQSQKLKPKHQKKKNTTFSKEAEENYTINQITGIIMRTINGSFSGEKVHDFVKQKIATKATTVTTEA